jgi:hypothetical protein
MIWLQRWTSLNLLRRPNTRQVHMGVFFDRRGFLKSRPSRFRGCSSPPVPHLQPPEVSSAQVSDQEGFVIDPQLSAAKVASPS